MDANDAQVLINMLILCNEIDETIERYGDTLDTFLIDKDYRKSVLLSILEIGELSKELSQQFKDNTSGAIPWQRMRSYRNYIAHARRQLDYEEVFYTAKNDIPLIMQFCENWVLP